MRARRAGSSVVEMPFSSSTTVLAAPHFVRNHVRTRIITPPRSVLAGAGPCGFFVGLVPTPSGLPRPSRHSERHTSRRFPSGSRNSNHWVCPVSSKIGPTSPPRCASRRCTAARSCAWRRRDQRPQPADDVVPALPVGLEHPLRVLHGQPLESAVHHGHPGPFALGGQGNGDQTGEPVNRPRQGDRKSTRLNSSHGYISYAVFCF